MDRYRVLGQKLGKFSCVSLNTYDHVLAGERGEVWYFGKRDGKSVYRSCMTTDVGRENTHEFGPEDLQKWVHRLRIPMNPERQLVWANNPNLKHDRLAAKKAKLPFDPYTP